MKIFGKEWDGRLDHLYKDDFWNGIKIKAFIGNDDPLIYNCYICRNEFLHWLCDDSIWNQLSKKLQKKKLCWDCFLNARKKLKK